MHSKIIFVILAALVSLATSTKTGPKSCKSNEFWYQDKNCCLPDGGPKSKPPPPPQGSLCPPTNYYWGQQQGCCVPKHPPPSNPPPPQCPRGWLWYKSVFKCLPLPTPPSTPNPHPSPKPGDKDCDDKGKGSKGNDKDKKDNHDGGKKGGNDRNHHHRRQEVKSRQTLCPTGLDACPIAGLTGDYECVDYATELEFCGGCTTLGKGQDCTQIPGAWNVGCEQGSCVVLTCAGGFKLSPDARSCIEL